MGSSVMNYPLFYKEVVMIRKAVVEDLHYIKEIYNDAVRNSTATFDITEKGDDFFKTMFDEHSGKRIFYVYEKDNKAVAYVTLSKFSHRDAYDTTVELSVYVNKDYRHQHIATELMEFAINFAKECNGIYTIVSLITDENKESIHLHKKYGFQFCGKIKKAGVKFNRDLNVDIYQLIF